MSERPFPPRGMAADDAAYYLGISVTKLYQLIHEGALPERVEVAPGCRRWLKDDLDRYLDQRRGLDPVYGETGNEWLAGDGEGRNTVRERVPLGKQAVPLLPAPRLPRAASRRARNG